MRKIFFLAITALFSFSTFALTISPMSNTWDATGTLTLKDRVTKQVKNVSGGTLAAGTLVIHATSECDDGACVTTTTNAIQTPACVLEQSLADDAIGACLVYGYTDKILFDNALTAVAGESGYISTATAGYVAAVASASVGAYMKPVGSFFDASAAYGAIEFFVNLL